MHWKANCMTRRALVLGLSLAATLGDAACEAGRNTIIGVGLAAESASAMKIRLKIGEKVLSASLIDSETTRDFISLLPLTLTMNDLFRREKSGDLPRRISEGGQRTRSYDVGDIIYWSPSAHLAIYYRHDGETIPSPGIIVIGKIDSGVEALNVSGPAKVTIEVSENR
jgi:hypothetical protein